jgi:glycine betaine catabolism B
MLKHAIGIIQDFGAYLTVAREKLGAPPDGEGIDYRDERWQQVVARTVARIHPQRMRLKLVAVLDETASTRTFRFERVDEPLPPFRAGQYVNLFVTIDGVRTSRPYSISSAPGQPHLDLTVRIKPGGFVTRHLFEGLRVADELESTGPQGHFYHEPLIDGDDLVFLAGGSGITPFLSMIRHLVPSRPDKRVHLLLGSRANQDVIAAKELKALAKAHDHFKLTVVLSEPPRSYRGARGLLDADRIRKSVGDVAGRMFYVCGPDLMLDLCGRALEELGVPRHRVRKEVYGPPDDVTGEPGWPEGLAGDAEFTVRVGARPPNVATTFRARADEPLLNALERAGVLTPVICRSGACSACRARLLEGQVFMPTDVGLRESDRDHGYIHACAAYPVSDIRVRI